MDVPKTKLVTILLIIISSALTAFSETQRQYAERKCDELASITHSWLFKQEMRLLYELGEPADTMKFTNYTIYTFRNYNDMEFKEGCVAETLRSGTVVEKYYPAENYVFEEVTRYLIKDGIIVDANWEFHGTLIE